LRLSCTAEGSRRKWFAFANRTRHGTPDEFEEALAILRVANALRSELLGGADA
jgi:hypothetical protein